MERILFVTNGNGEIAIAERIAIEVAQLDPVLQIDHLALVGIGRSEHMADVGPQSRMPSGGLIAMGNVRNIASDVRAGLVGLTLGQRAFLVAARGRYGRVAAVGDVFALLMSLAAHAPVTFVGTAKSVRVAQYGPFERTVLRRAERVFVRDLATAERLRAQGVDAQAPGNVIVDLFASADDERADEAFKGFTPAIAMFPGSREGAYDDALMLSDIVARLAPEHPNLGAVLSVAPRLDIARFERLLSSRWTLGEHRNPAVAFELRAQGRTFIRAWRGPIGPLLKRAALVIGQAGTANEAAAAGGIAVVAIERGNNRKDAWYRKRQRGLLGNALAVFPGDPEIAVRELSALLADDARRARMGREGRENMGPPGGARAIATMLVEPI